MRLKPFGFGLACGTIWGMGLALLTLWALLLGMLGPSNPVLLRALSGVLVALAVSVILMSLRPFLRPAPLGDERRVTAAADAAPF